MNISKLLRGHNCNCGKRHICNIHNVVIEEGAINKIYDLTTDYKHIIVVADTTDLILGVGSGVIQDLCKYVSFKRGLPYYIAATAPSMDGYASTGAAMIMGNMKVTYNAHVPKIIIADVDILKDAPMEMIMSGYGEGGNDEAVYKSDFNYILIDDYRDFAKRIQVLL